MCVNCDRQPLLSGTCEKVELHCSLWQLSPKRQELFEEKRLENVVIIFFCLFLLSSPLMWQVINCVLWNVAGRCYTFTKCHSSLDIFLSFVGISGSTHRKAWVCFIKSESVSFPNTISNHHSGFPACTVLMNRFNIKPNIFFPFSSAKQNKCLHLCGLTVLEL